MSFLGHVSLRISPNQWPQISRFYSSILGMTMKEVQNQDSSATSSTVSYLFRYPRSKSPYSCGVEFILDENISSNYAGKSSDFYWKIGIALDDVDSGVKSVAENLSLQAKNCPSSVDPTNWQRSFNALRQHCRSKGNQFIDVGYLTHIRDNAWFPIELLQTTFENNENTRKQLIDRNTKRAQSEGLRSTPFGITNKASPVVGQITTRTSDIKKSLQFYQNVLGMKLLATEDVSMYGFELYFLAFENCEIADYHKVDRSNNSSNSESKRGLSTVPPNSKDLEDVKNREWLYQRRYTTLEIQYAVNSKPNSIGNTSKKEEARCDGITIYIGDNDGKDDGISGGNCKLKEGDYIDPDGLPIRVRKITKYI